MKKLIFILILISLLIFIKNTVVSIIQLSQNSKTIDKLDFNLKSAKQENVLLQQKLYYVKSDEFIEEQARNKLNLVKNGEYMVIAPPPQGKLEQTKKDEIPNWKRWWKLFF